VRCDANGLDCRVKPGNDGCILTLIKAGRVRPSHAQHLNSSARCRMSSVDLFYLGVVLAAFFGFAVALAYYSHR
jgi:hypothetical protein